MRTKHLKLLPGLLAAVALLMTPASANANAIYVDFDTVEIHDKLDGDLTSCGDFVAASYKIAWAPVGGTSGLFEDGHWNLLIPEATLLTHGFWHRYWRQCDNTTYDLLNTYPDPAGLFDYNPTFDSLTPQQLASLTYYMHGGASRLALSGQPGQQFDLFVGGNEFDPAIGLNGTFAGEFEKRFTLTAPPAGVTWGLAKSVTHTGGGPDLKITLTGTIRTAPS